MNDIRAAGTVLVLAIAAASGTACSLKLARVDRALKFYGRALALEIAPIENSPAAGSTMDLRLILRNVSQTETVRACLGYSREYVLFAEPIIAGRKPLAIDTRVIDHPGCDRRFELTPGAKLEWIDRASVNIGPGAARLSGFVSVVHPADCDRYGCYDTYIKAPDLQLIVR
jgi:hypothetical protein